MPRLLIVAAHPDPDSFTLAVARRMADTATAAGAPVTFHDLYRTAFDPRLTIAEARGRSSDDPLVQAHIRDLVDADVFIAVHPNWWGGPPALLKGWIDRVFAPGAAYDFEKKIDEGGLPIPLLRTRAALIVNTSNTPEEREATAFGDPLERMWRDCLLGFCGVQVIDRWVLRIIATSTPEQRAQWLSDAECRVSALMQPLTSLLPS